MFGILLFMGFAVVYVLHYYSVISSVTFLGYLFIMLLYIVPYVITRGIMESKDE